MSRNIFEDLQSAFPSAPADPSEQVTLAVGGAGPGGEAPPPYSTLPASAVEFSQQQWAGPGAYVGIGYSLAGMKLSYMDVVPRLVRKRMLGKDEYESFSTLLQRANTWLEDHANLQLISCETVTWLGASHKEIFSDSSMFRRVSGVTTYMRGIRFWYLTKMVPSPTRGTQGVLSIHCLTVPARVTENISQLMKRVNEKITGKILSVETIRLNREDGVVNTESTIWKEDSSDTKQFIFAVRVFSILQQTSAKETVGFQDFIPDKTARSRENRGYELHSDVMERAGRWIARQQGVRFTNLQTLPIKIKKEMGFAERCAFTEHGRRATMYLHVVRAYFVIQNTTPGASVDHVPSARLTYRTFSPVQIAAASGNTAAKFEDVRSLLERINHWVQSTGAHLFSMETLPVRMGSQLSSNATFVPNQDGSAAAARFLYLIRIYLNGDYIETPSAAALVY